MTAKEHAQLHARFGPDYSHDCWSSWEPKPKIASQIVANAGPKSADVDGDNLKFERQLSHSALMQQTAFLFSKAAEEPAE